MEIGEEPKVGRVLVTGDALMKGIAWPAGTTLREIRPTHKLGIWEFYIEHWTFEDIGEGQEIPLYQVIAERVYASFEKVKDMYDDSEY